MLDEPCPALSKPAHVARAANCLQQKARPEQLKDLDFELVEECLPPGFFKANLTVYIGTEKPRRGVANYVHLHTYN